MASPVIGQSGADFVRRALRSLKIIDAIENPDPTELADGMVGLNGMFDSWNADGLMIFTTRFDDFLLTGAKQTYTLGAGGDFDIDRPVEIDRASIIILSNPNQPLEYPIPVYSTQDWQEKVPIKNSPGNLPLLVYDDGGFPLRNLTFWPFASDNVRFRLYGWQKLSKFTDPNQKYVFPEGYEECIRWNLCIRLAAEFGATLTPEIVGLAMTSMATVKGRNADDAQLRSDLIGTRYASKMRSELFNIP